jgi:2-polyprenyl-3-methyl-5-hydroxy-6-metoxy-1,4-benzoquinol methylase
MGSPQAASWFGRDRKPPQFYRGLRIKADTNLHEQLQGLISDSVSPAAHADRKAKVLDLGCGEGALAQRLVDLGYDVLAVDCEPAQFKAHGPTFVCVDLNDPAAVDQLVAEHLGAFDLILAVELIEHLRCPWDFVAACRRLCRPDTHLILTTPNVSSWWSRLWFFLTGDLWSFGPESLHDPGHISPLPVATMRAILRQNGLECVDITAAGSLPIVWAYNWKRLLLSLALLPLRWLMRGEKDGWVLCYHAKQA